MAEKTQPREYLSRDCGLNHTPACTGECGLLFGGTTAAEPDGHLECSDVVAADGDQAMGTDGQIRAATGIAVDSRAKVSSDPIHAVWLWLPLILVLSGGFMLFSTNGDTARLGALLVGLALGKGFWEENRRCVLCDPSRTEEDVSMDHDRPGQNARSRNG
jgi:hypothetical protein